jgi:hypothetical protein
LDGQKLAEARDYALKGGGSGYVIYQGTLVMAWGSPSERYSIKSVTKSIGATALGLAIQDNLISLEDPFQQCHPGLGVPPDQNAGTGWLDDITVLNLATHTAGFDKTGGYSELLFEPGTMWSYSDGGPNWLAECLTQVYRQDLENLLFDRIFVYLGISRDDLGWRQNQYREQMIDGIERREFGSGIQANVDALARLGYLYLHGGEWDGQQLLPKSFVEAAGKPVPGLVGIPVRKPKQYGDASDHYGILWWNNADGTMENVPRDAFWAWGLGDHLIVVIPSLDLVASRAGDPWGSGEIGNYESLEPFLESISLAVKSPAPVDPAPGTVLPPTEAVAPFPEGYPYPPSAVITGLNWAPADTILRAAKGSDNFPLTWADDGELYTAYGDGWGFEPRVEEKLSLGFARISGDPQDLQAENIRSEDELRGEGESGKKASGLLMVDGRLYMWVRNANLRGEGCQLAWSDDRARSWTWSDWTFAEFGYCTFINYGQNYAGERDDYIYTVTHDHPSAYQAADQFILMRVHKSQVRDRNAYEFFSGTDLQGQPTWTEAIEERSPVFTNPGMARRSSVSYNAALGRYLWWQGFPHSGDERASGGFGVFDAPEPWGPWTTVYLTENWDVGPGETASFPTKWMSEDGKTITLVFSGNDHFSTRQADLMVNAGENP